MSGASYKTYLALTFIVVLIKLFTVSNAHHCIPRDFGDGSVVCVCNSTYCDSTPETPILPGTFLWYASSESGQRMNLTVGKIVKNSKASTVLTLYPEIGYQRLKGFGGAFTDSTGINVKKLSEPTQEKLLETYFSKEGSRYNLGRIPIGGTDFSTRKYTYDDVPNDIQLEKFKLAEEDLIYKIPLIQKALKMNPDLWFLSAAWTAPPWMKTNNDYTGKGFLKKKYYQLYADYLLKFLDEYRSHGIKMWSISTGNEPMTAYFPETMPINTMGWKSEDVANWIAENLGPSLANSQHNKTLILIVDDQKNYLLLLSDRILENEKASKFVSGIAYHFYVDFFLPAFVTDIAHYFHPDKFLLMTEGCQGAMPGDIPKVRLGYWKRAEMNAKEIIENLYHWSTGWVDWNLVLDKQGGPNWVKNFVDASIIVNPETDEFFKQPLYYSIHHFSRFLPRGSILLDLKDNSIFFHPLDFIAFETPEKKTVIIIYNSEDNSKEIDIVDSRNGVINIKLTPVSLNTIVYQSNGNH